MSLAVGLTLLTAVAQVQAQDAAASAAASTASSKVAAAHVKKYLFDYGVSRQIGLRSLEPVRVSQDGVDFTVQPREKAEFEAAMAALRAADFDKAADLYGQFMRRYPDSGYSPAALYWQGNARYASRDYKPAIDSYRALIAKVPNHARVPEAMLAIANCQQELKDAKAAKRTLEELFKSYPKTEAGIAARDRLARMQ